MLINQEENMWKENKQKILWVEIIKMYQTCWNCQKCEKFNVLFDGRWWYAFWMSYNLLSKMETISWQKKKVQWYYMSNFRVKIETKKDLIKLFINSLVWFLIVI